MQIQLHVYYSYLPASQLFKESMDILMSKQILNLTPNACQCIIYLMFIPQLVLYLVPQIYKLLLHVLCGYLYILVLNHGGISSKSTLQRIHGHPNVSRAFNQHAKSRSMCRLYHSTRGGHTQQPTNTMTTESKLSFKFF
jgi:hypothetical protein